MKSEPQKRIGCLNTLFLLVGGAMLVWTIQLFKASDPMAIPALLATIIILILGLAAAKAVLAGILFILFGCVMFSIVYEGWDLSALIVAIISVFIGIAVLFACAAKNSGQKNTPRNTGGGNNRPNQENEILDSPPKTVLLPPPNSSFAPRYSVTQPYLLTDSPEYNTRPRAEAPQEQQREAAVSPVASRVQKMAIVRLDELDRMSGQEFEKAMVMLLPCLGFSRVQWIGGAGDQGADIIAYKSGDYYAIQCKRYSKDLGNRPVQEVYAGMKYHGCNKGMVITNSYFTAGAKELAFKNGVLLRDRNWLADALEMQNRDGESPITSIEQIDAMSGGEFEQYMVEALPRLGFENIQYVGGASGNGVDILAQKNGVQYAIQCNRYQGSVDESTVQEAIDGATAYECEKAIVVTSSHFTKAAEALAERHNVLLWDREWLMFLLEKFQAEQE